MMLKTSGNLPKENWMTGPYFFDSCRITLCSKGLVYTAILRMKMSYIILLNKYNKNLNWILNSLGLFINTSTTYDELIPCWLWCNIDIGQITSDQGHEMPLHGSSATIVASVLKDMDRAQKWHMHICMFADKRTWWFPKFLRTCRV